MRARLAIAVLVVSLAVSGCSDDEEPDAGPTLPPVTEAPSPSSEAVPTEATAATPEGAAEFVRYFYEQVERAYQEAEPRYIAELSAPGCRACERFVSSLTQIRDAGQRAEGVTYDIVGAVAPELEGPTARVDVVYNGPEVKILDAAGQVVVTEPAVKLASEQVDLVMVDGAWRVQEVTKT